ncbi:carbon-nitrogen hydrolase family protein [Desulfothermobacter acidiphilus]|uniref:carbon-nitrogen hydrolase family protein n=1 Tax=Desulfothermobacter acidiphilus TaxID=1938353 RepID=UPI003F8AD002
MRVGVAQTFVADTLEENERTILQLAEKAARRGVDLIAFPEMSLTGYNPVTLTAPNFEQDLSLALERLAQRVQELGLGVIVGRAERWEHRCFNAATVLLPGGDTFTYRKIYLTEKELPHFTSGSQPLVFSFRGYRCGVIICRDQNYPELARQLRDLGAELIFILAAHFYPPKEARWKQDKNLALPLARATENACYVLLANAVGSHLGLISLGRSLIADPDGALVALADEASECILTCDLKDRL